MERVAGISGLLLRACDPERLSRWYAEYLGVDAATESSEAAATVVFTDLLTDPDHRAGPASSWALTFGVADLDAMVSQLRDAGIEVDVDPGRHPDSRLASLRDPEGNLVRLGQAADNGDQPWSSEPAYVHAISDDASEEVRFSRARPARRRWTRWVPLLLAGLIAMVAITIVKTGQEPAEPTTTALTPATRSSTESEVVTPVEEPVVDDVGRRLLGVTADWEVFARGLGEVVRIELAEGRITRTPFPGLDSTGPVSFLVGPDRVLIRPLDSVPGYVVPDGRPARELPRTLNHGGAIFPGPKPNQVWVEPGAPSHEAMSLITLDGRKTGRSIPMPAGEFWPIASDGNGYLLVDGVGGVYLARTDGLRRVTTGALLAVGPTHFLTLECDDRSRCSRSVIDRATGNRRILAGNVRMGSLGPPGVISPDGSMAAVLHADSRGQHGVHLIDLASGAEDALDIAVGFNGEHDIAWSPDSRWLLIANEELLAVDAHTKRIRELDVELPPINQVAVRNTTGS